MRAVVAALLYPHPSLSGEVHVAGSVGVVVAHDGIATFGIHEGGLLKVAGDALDRAKEGGRDRVDAAIPIPIPASDGSDGAAGIAHQDVG